MRPDGIKLTEGIGWCGSVGDTRRNVAPPFQRLDNAINRRVVQHSVWLLLIPTLSPLAFYKQMIPLKAVSTATKLVNRVVGCSVVQCALVKDTHQALHCTSVKASYRLPPAVMWQYCVFKCLFEARFASHGTGFSTMSYSTLTACPRRQR